MDREMTRKEFIQFAFTAVVCMALVVTAMILANRVV